MTTRIESKVGHIGYRHQLDRARRFLERLKSAQTNDVEFQDMVWAFFQNCWHIKDWLRNDPCATVLQKNTAIEMAEQSLTLNVCQDLCNGTKHLKLTSPVSGTGATHGHVAFTLNASPAGFPDIPNEIDCILDDGRGSQISAKKLAEQCIAEWESILESQGLATARLS